ncbi:MAG: PhzF family phenazine biosynthesis protein [Candidatus Promineifilaceae bacterium]|nr:PhzF family phenazine biosynthesis protein [Candidatus Promineifilaceae bacterium]
MSEKEIELHILSAFVDGDRGGNPAGVVLDADDLGRQARQRLAARIGLSEIAFVSASEKAAFKLEFFTPTRQIAHCGHATVATFAYLAQIGRVSRGRSAKETIDGVRVIILAEDMAFMEQQAPRYQSLDREEMAALLDSLSLTANDLLPGHRPVVVNTGNSFLLVPLPDEITLAKLRPQHDRVARVSQRLGLVGYYPFTLQTQVPGRDAAARMFAPHYGIPEESATGMAAGPLACYFFDKFRRREQRFVIEQGRLMDPPSPSELIVDLNVTAGRVQSLMAGGRARLVETCRLSVESP